MVNIPSHLPDTCHAPKPQMTCSCMANDRPALRDDGKIEKIRSNHLFLLLLLSFIPDYYRLMQVSSLIYIVCSVYFLGKTFLSYDYCIVISNKCLHTKFYLHVCSMLDDIWLLAHQTFTYCSIWPCLEPSISPNIFPTWEYGTCLFVICLFTPCFCNRISIDT